MRFKVGDKVYLPDEDVTGTLVHLERHHRNIVKRHDENGWTHRVHGANCWFVMLQQIRLVTNKSLVDAALDVHYAKL